jgi:hypothetical protein
MHKPVWWLAIVLNVTGMLHAVVHCGGPDKPVVAPNPTAADCIAARTKAELDCITQNDAEAAADRCLADVKRTHECVDGGT